MSALLPPAGHHRFNVSLSESVVDQGKLACALEAKPMIYKTSCPPPSPNLQSCIHQSKTTHPIYLTLFLSILIDIYIHIPTLNCTMTSPETRTQPFDMVPEDDPRQRRGSMVDDATFGDMREGRRRGSNGSDSDQLPLSKSDRRMYELTYIHLPNQQSITH